MNPEPANTRGPLRPPAVELHAMSDPPVHIRTATRVDSCEWQQLPAGRMRARSGGASSRCVDNAGAVQTAVSLKGWARVPAESGRLSYVAPTMSIRQRAAGTFAYGNHVAASRAADYVTIPHVPARPVCRACQVRTGVDS